MIHYSDLLDASDIIQTTTNPEDIELCPRCLVRFEEALSSDGEATTQEMIGTALAIGIVVGIQQGHIFHGPIPN